MKTLRSRRRRREQRGAVLVEAIVVSAMLMMFMASGLFLNRLYVAQHRAIEQARLAAWSQAMQGCAGAVDLDVVWQGAGANEAPVDVDTESAPSFFGAVHHTSGSASQTASAHQRAGGGSFTLNASDSVACNEVPQNGRNIASLVGNITSNVIPSFF
jgi:uncharacterized membrane protein